MRFAECHPERKHAAHGLCSACATKRYYKHNPEVYARHKEKCKQRAASGYYKESMQNSKFKYRYGITLKDREKLIQDQKGKCKICDKEKKLVVEHCHKTGKIRGMTCHGCNTFVACVENNIDIVHKIFGYIFNWDKNELR